MCSPYTILGPSIGGPGEQRVKMVIVYFIGKYIFLMALMGFYWRLGFRLSSFGF